MAQLTPSDIYVNGVKWIAGNDEPGELDPEEIAGYISTCLLAEVTNTPVETVAADIAHVRKERR